jgi:hypothetical protein
MSVAILCQVGVTDSDILKERIILNKCGRRYGRSVSQLLKAKSARQQSHHLCITNQFTYQYR